MCTKRPYPVVTRLPRAAGHGAIASDGVTIFIGRDGNSGLLVGGGWFARDADVVRSRHQALDGLKVLSRKNTGCRAVCGKLKRGAERAGQNSSGEV